MQQELCSQTHGAELILAVLLQEPMCHCRGCAWEVLLVQVKTDWVLRAQHPSLPNQAHPSSISASGSVCCSDQGCITWLRTMLHCPGSCYTAQDHVTLLRTTLQSARPHCMVLYDAASLAGGAGTEPCVPPSTQHGGVKSVMGLTLFLPVSCCLESHLCCCSLEHFLG